MDRGERRYGREIAEKFIQMPPLPALPILSAEQLRALDARWPERSPQLHDEMAMLMWNGGARFVVRCLLQAFEEANKK